MRKYLLLLAMLIPSFAFAIGEQYGRITGTVYDPSGNEAPGSKLVLTSKALIGGSRTVISSSDGSFTFNTLASGSYDLKVTNPQTKTYTQSGIRVSVGKTVSLYIALEAGDPTSIVATEPAAPNPGPDMTSGGEFTGDLICDVPAGRSWPGNQKEQTFSSPWSGAQKNLQELPKQGQSLEDFVVLLPTMQEAKDSLLYAAQPVQVVEDGFLLPSSRKVRR